MQVAIALFPRNTSLDAEPPFDSGDLVKAPEATHRPAMEFYQHRN